MDSLPLDNRLAHVLAGPWAHQAAEAEQFLAKKRKTTVPLRSSFVTSAGSPKRVRTAELSNIFRAHWHQPVTDAQQLVVRKSFQQALTTLQLLELGLQTNYYSPDQLQAPVVARLEELFWSQPAVDYLSTYAYVGVRFLAARYQVDLGLPVLPPPAPSPGAEIQYAVFLATYTQFYEDPAIDACVQFLDTSLTTAPEQNAFKDFLSLRAIPAPSASLVNLYQTSNGFYKLIIWLSDIFSLVEQHQVKHFALFFFDWLAKLAGYTPFNAPAQPHPLTNWLDYFKHAPASLLGVNGYDLQDLLPEERKQIKKSFQQRLTTIARAWTAAQTELARLTQQAR